jgi:hypothetical protein
MDHAVELACRRGSGVTLRAARSLRIVALPLALLVGVLALLLGQDVRAWPRTLHDDALRAYRAPAEPPRLTASTTLPSGISESLLGVGLDREWLRALQTFTVAYQTTYPKNQLASDDYALLNHAQAALGKVTQDPDPRRASQAYNLLAVLVFREAYPGTVVVRRLVQEALTDEQNAVRLDQADEAAKENLELTLRVLVVVNLEQREARAAGSRRASARQGGYEGPPGAGY